MPQYCDVVVMSSEVETSALCAILITQAITKVMPVGVDLSDQSQFLIAPPVLNLLFSFNSTKDAAERLNVNQRVDLVMMGKTFD